MSFEVRPVEEDEFPQFSRTLVAAFGGSPPPGEEIEEWRQGMPLDRTLAAFEGREMAGTTASFAFELTVPGQATVQAAGVSWVGVLPTFRRRGVLTALMRRQIDNLRGRGELVAILLASESAIYGRFGYGMATTQAKLEIEKGRATLRDPVETPGRLTLLDKDAAAEVLPPVYDKARLRQPGFITRDPIWWKHLLVDRESWRNGASARFYVTHTDPSGSVDGYAFYRIKGEWESGLPKGCARVGDFVALSPEAYIALWKYLTSLDLVSTIEFRDRPVDEPIRWMLADPRRLRIMDLCDFLWVRLIDPIGALSARRYQMDGRLVFALTDSFCPDNSGCYELVGGPEGAECRKTDSEPEVILAADDLGAAYLGGTRFSSLARAGRVRETTPDALHRADAMFGSDPLPWCSTDF